MIKKDIFIEALRKIQEDEEAQEKFCKAFNEYSNSCSYDPIMINRLTDVLLKVLEDDLGDTDDTISWWLYEAPEFEKYIYEDDDPLCQGEKKYDLSTAENLYNYLIEQNKIFKFKQPIFYLKYMEQTKKWEIFDDHYFVAENEEEYIIGWNYNNNFEERKYEPIKKCFVFATREEAEKNLREIVSSEILDKVKNINSK